MSPLVVTLLVSGQLITNNSPCDPKAQMSCVTIDQSGQPEVYSGTDFDTELRLHFVSSKGAFASAMAMQMPLSNTCNLDGTTPNCLLFTNDCGCPQDPNSMPGELSCFCAPKPSYFVAGLGAGTQTSLQGSLLIDKNRDRKTDDIRFMNSAKGKFYKLYKSAPGLYQIEWEDLMSEPDGDFNDYVAALEVRSCNGDLPPSLPSPETERWSCGETCRACDPQDLDTQEFRISMSVGIDALPGENDLQSFDREAAGRKIVVGTSIYNLNSSETVALCPYLRFWKEDEFLDWDVTYLQYSGSPGPGCNFSPTGSGEPQCADTRATPSDDFAVWFASEQFYSADTQCKGRQGEGDGFSLPAQDNCGAGSESRFFEMNIDDIDAVLPQVTEQFHFQPAINIFKYRLREAGVAVFRNINTATFHCPSGVAAEFNGADPSVATAVLRRFGWDQNDPTHTETEGLNLYLRE